VKEPFKIKTETDSVGNTYTGQFYKNRRHGYGKIIYSQGDPRKSFEGQFINGSKVYGLLIFKNMNKYLGQFKDDLYHGKGLYTWNDSRTYYGEWSKGNRNGHGIHKWPSGDVYIG